MDENERRGLYREAMSNRYEILILDDEPIVGERLKPFIEKDGYRVETFIDPVQALERLESKDFDIVISDIRTIKKAADAPPGKTQGHAGRPA
jgi:DNA-binding NtrC family response regulator